MKKNELFLAYLLLTFTAAPTCLASSIVLQWDPNTEADLAGYRIYYKANSSQLPFDGAGAIEGAAPIEVANQTTATVNGLDPGTDYYFAVTAYNTSGVESTYSNIITIAKVTDVTAPTVSLTSPSAGSTLGGVVSITASASDDIGVNRVEFYQNSTLLAASNLSPYRHNWDTTAVSNGAYTLVAKAYDAAGNSTSSSLQVVVLNDTTAPTVAITSPAGGGTVGGAALVSATATDNVAVSKVEFYINGALQATSNSAPYSFSWNTGSVANGSYTLSAKAYDGSGNIGQSANVAVTVQNVTADTTAPSVAFLSPTTGSIYDNNVKVSASAADNVEVARMELYVDGNLKSTAGSNSLSASIRLGKGSHTLTVKAYDSSNNVGSKSMTVNRIY